MLYLSGDKMTQNPLQKYFRQPKLSIGLPSKGLYAPPDTIDGNPNSLTVFAMTGMDEIILKTPDSLFNGESTVKVIESCCPSIKDAWKVSAIDLDHLLIAIRIATYGNEMTIEHTCGNCGAQNDFDVNLGPMIDHFDHAEYDDTIHVNELAIRIRPLTYKEMTEFNLKNFALQKKLVNAAQNFDDPENQKTMNDVYQQLAELQNELYISSIATVAAPEGVVDQQEYIKEWLKNSESIMFERIKQKVEENRKVWKIPPVAVECTECGTRADLEITMDQANFFVRNS